MSVSPQPGPVSCEQGPIRVRPGIELAGLSDIGCQRENNEDCFAYWEPDADEQFELKGRLAIVADGMGGYEGGEEASRLAVQTVRDVYSSAPNGDAQAALLRALQTAHERIRDYADKHAGHYGMGTTCTALVLKGDFLHFAHVGDSRLYLSRGTGISQLTKDDSYVSRLVQSGLISSKEAENHPQRHILTAALGTGHELLPQSPDYPVPLENGDIVILCTDGLWGQVSPTELRGVVTTRPPMEACRELVNLARERGGPDNITVQLFYL